MNYSPEITPTTVRMGTSKVDGLSLFYREAGTPGNPRLVLLGGFPASSHQFRNLIPALAARFHIISMDYPGFGNSDMPDTTAYSYTFERKNLCWPSWNLMLSRASISTDTKTRS